ncbi:MAG: glycoside hydrolase family 2 protein [Lachnospiraceae bacterium]|nr:glycoside hydrolase family 2 protein [Lachnospiraceae bacterium]
MELKKKIELNDNWTLEVRNTLLNMKPGETLRTSLPASVYNTLIENDLMGEPTVGEREFEALELMKGEFIFETTFDLDIETLSSDALSLVFYGIDTLADVVLNGIELGHTDNMHRTWRFDVSSVVSSSNRLTVAIHSPTAYIAEKNKKVFAGGTPDAMEGFPHLRKAHCMFGWDWGQRLPDAGLFRGVELIAHNRADISEVRVYQEHVKTGRGIHGYIIPEVRLHVTTEINVCEEGEPVTVGDIETLHAMGLKIITEVVSPDCAVYKMEERKRGRILDEEGEKGVTNIVKIPDPKLWWPNGYGEQPLYEVCVKLTDRNSGEVLDENRLKIGLRILTVNQDPVSDGGKNFAFKVNGLQIFSMGADYIPEDNILPRVNRERSEKLLDEAVKANYNMIRVWGGGYYPDDWFFDLCDEKGLIVWQDFMFACADYELDEDFESSIRAEIADNVKRIRHHACLGLWCGNNEVETQVIDGAWKPSMKQRADYLKIFEYIIPGILKKLDPDTCYWPSSPSSGGNFDNPWAENIGDAHYWGVWHACEPFTAYRDHSFRFVSEFGFQSFPCLDTIKRFASDDELNIFSRTMELHQRNSAANGKIMMYLAKQYLYPKNFEMLIYASQMLQADAVRYGLEHFRRNRGTTMGAVVWQLNDISPVASWSCIDSPGNRKALYYAERRAFAPVMISCEEHGELDQRPDVNAQPAPVNFDGRIHVANETEKVFTGKMGWALRDPKSQVLTSGEESVTILPYDGKYVYEVDADAMAGFDQLSHHLEFSLTDDSGAEVSRGMVLFCAPKHYRFAKPAISVKRDGSRVVVESDSFASGVCIMDGGHPAVLSDNFFHIEAGVRELELEKEPEGELSVVSVYDIAGM